jgi:DNA-binding transcriptional LysR family regulator
VELRHLRYFVAVAEELHFARAAERLHISTPSLSQQIKSLEAGLGTPLFVRDRRHVELTAAGELLLTDAREILALTANAERRLQGTSGPLRLGYVSWLPDQLGESAGSDVRVDEWVMPSHAQVARVLEGGLDAAIAWVAATDERLVIDLLRVEVLSAVVPAGPRGGLARASELRVLVGADLASWDSWNRFAREFAADTGATVVEIDDGGIAGRGFYDHCRRLYAPVLQSPKRQPASLPPGLRVQAVSGPTPLWCWSLVTRSGDDRSSVRALREAAGGVVRAAEPLTPGQTPWLPPGDPHRGVLVPN